MKYLKTYEEMISVHDNGYKLDFEFDPQVLQELFKRFIKYHEPDIIRCGLKFFSIEISKEDLEKFYDDGVGELLKILIHNIILYSKKNIRSVNIDLLNRLKRKITISDLKKFLNGYHFGLFGLSFKEWIDWYQREYPERVEAQKFKF